MPELPEVETMCRGIAGIVGGRLLSVERMACPRKSIVLQPRLDRWRQRVHGQTITAVTRAGKRVVVELAAGDAIVIEPRMTGLVLVADPPDPIYLRLRFVVQRARARTPSHFYYWDRRGLGVVQLLSAVERDRRLGPDVLGPDALAATPELLRDRLARSRRPIKVALLDQRAIAGIGNLYAAEILHASGIHPCRRCDQLTRPQWQRLAEAMLHVLHTAIRHEGSTLGDGTYRNALSQAGGYQNHHRVYDRAGETCPTCRRATIVRIVQAQRSTFYCPHCQTASLAGRQRSRPSNRPAALALVRQLHDDRR